MNDLPGMRRIRQDVSGTAWAILRDVVLPAMLAIAAVLVVTGAAMTIIGAARGAETWPVCRGGDRAARKLTCVVDGDTIWLRGEKIRIADIDAPELRGRCRAETELARAARDRLRVILRGADLEVRRAGRDRYGRTLATIRAGRIEVGEALIAGGHAAPWRGRKADWCGGR